MNKVLKSPRNLTFLGIMLAITIILDSTPLGAIPVGAISATITHIPTIITGIILGPVAGLIMGTCLGFVSLIHALTRPVGPLDPLFVNPLISVLPRMLIGVTAYYAYAGLTKVIKGVAGRSVSGVVAGAVGSLTNTGMVFLMLYLIYAQKVVESVGMAFGALLVLIFTTNAVAEALVSAIITTVIVTAYFQYSKTRH